jgi:sugar lactone lactonase YvrE
MLSARRLLKTALVLVASLCSRAQTADLAASNGIPANQNVGPVITVATFDVTQSEFPEGLAIDKWGNLYAALTFTGEIWKMTPEGEQSILTTLSVGSSGGLLVGLAVDKEGNLYVCDATFESGTHGIWKVAPNGASSLFAALDRSGFPNAMAFDDTGNLLVTDSSLGLIWKISPSGQTAIWFKDPLLSPVTSFGANGIEFDRGALWVANTDQGTIVRIELDDDGPRQAEVFVQSPALVGADGIAFDVRHNLYVAVDSQNTLVRVSPNRRITTLAGASGGLDYPASTSFGETSCHRKFLFWTNGGIDFGTPSIQKMDIGIPGVALPLGQE